ncbi:MAG TPA: FG-GAP-like repeat-containing protein [Chloroflexia bacterium]
MFKRKLFSKVTGIIAFTAAMGLMGTGTMWTSQGVSAQTAPPRPNKYVGLLYQTSINRVQGWATIENRIWPNIPPNQDDHMWWGRPLLGYYTSSDKAIINEHARLISNAGVDFILVDYSNGDAFSGTDTAVTPNKVINNQDRLSMTTLLLDTYLERIAAGLPTPKVAFFASSYKRNPDGTVNDLKRLYEQFYQDPKYSSLFFRAAGPNTKPLLLSWQFVVDPRILGCGAQIATNLTAAAYFDCKPTGAFSLPSSTPWGIIERYPQINHTKAAWSSALAASWPEEVAVSAAQQHYWMNIDAQFNIASRGRRYDYRKEGTGQPVQPVTAQQELANPSNPDRTGEGRNFIDQWAKAKDINPSFVIIDGWNMWAAGRTKGCQKYPETYTYEDCPTVNNVNSKSDALFNDQFSRDFSNDLEPMAGASLQPSGVSFGSAYYNLLVEQVAKYKRNSPNLYFLDNNNGNWYFKEGRKGTQFASDNFTHYVSNWGQGSQYQSVVGDFNGDKKTDIAVRDTISGGWTFRRNDGSTYTQIAGFSWAAGSNYTAVAGDWNGDGITDIGLRDANVGNTVSGNAYWHFVRVTTPSGPTGTLSFAYTNAIEWAAGTNYQAITGNFDNDKYTDIGVRDSTNGTWHFMHTNDTSGALFYGRNWSAGWLPGAQFQPITGNFDCDAYDDIGLRDTTNGNIYLANFTGNSYGFTGADQAGTGNMYRWQAGASIRIMSDPLACTP